MRLVPGVFGSEFERVKETPFDLHTGQMNSHKWGKNCGWYNKYGQKIGWGDLDTRHIRAIMHEIAPDEVFITMSEQYSFWEFVPNPTATLGSMQKTTPEHTYPGLEYLEEHGWLVIVKDKVHNLHNFGMGEFEGIKVHPLPREELSLFLKDYLKPVTT